MYMSPTYFLHKGSEALLATYCVFGRALGQLKNDYKLPLRKPEHISEDKLQDLEEQSDWSGVHPWYGLKL